MCSICSGRSQEFFNSLNKALVTPETCTRGVEACAPFFESLADITRQMEEAKPASSADQKTVHDIKDKLLVFAPPEHLLDLFAAYEEAKKRGDAKKEAYQICNSILNIRKKPYILLFNDEGVKEYLSIMKHRAKETRYNGILAAKLKMESEIRYIRKTDDGFRGDAESIKKRKDDKEGKVREEYEKLIQAYHDQEAKTVEFSKVKSQALRDNWDTTANLKRAAAKDKNQNQSKTKARKLWRNLFDQTVNPLSSNALISDTSVFGQDEMTLQPALGIQDQLVARTYNHLMHIRPMNLSLQFS